MKSDQRTSGFDGRVSVIFHVSDANELVTIVGVRYGGRELNTDE